MRFENGWVKLYRLRYDHWLESDMLAKAVLMKLVEWANYEDSPTNAKIILKRGQCVTSSIELSKGFKIGRQRIRRVLELMQERSVINLLSNQHGTIVTILNYDKYQPNEKLATNAATIEQPTGNQQTTNEQPLTKELKKKRNKEIKNSLSESVTAIEIIKPINPTYEPIAIAWLEFAKKEMPWTASQSHSNVAAYAKALEKVAKSTGLNLDGLNEVLKFVSADDFWRRNAVSPNGLLKVGGNGVRKIDNILSRMKPTRSKSDMAFEEFVNQKPGESRGTPF